MHNFSLHRLGLPILTPALLLTGLGLAAFYSIDLGFFKQQFISLIIGLFAYLVFLNIDYKIFGLYSKYIYFLMIASLAILFFIGIEARGSVRWLDILGVRIQFSEVIKPFYVIFVAYFLTRNDSRALSKFLATLLLLAPIFFLTLKQPDLGTAIIFAVVTVFMMFMYGFPFSYFIGAGILTLIPMPLIYGMLHDYQRERILTFIDPTRDPFGSSYNAVQALISIGSGGITGKGFGEATQSILKFLPERHTDFIFATITESLGFIGSMFLVGVYFFMLYKIYRLNQNVYDTFASLIISGFYFIFLTQIFFNIGMNIGILPIVGITLPFVSYGGNSLISSFVMLGIISSIASDFVKYKGSLEIR